MSRCKACDAVLDKHEIVWDEELKQHEDMCHVCRGIVADAEYEEVLSVYGEDTFDDLINKEGADEP